MKITGWITVALVVLAIAWVAFRSRQVVERDCEDPEAMYCVGWRSNLTDLRGQGSVEFTKNEVDRIIYRANIRHPEIEHYPIVSIEQ